MRSKRNEITDRQNTINGIKVIIAMSEQCRNSVDQDLQFSRTHTFANIIHLARTFDGNRTTVYTGISFEYNSGQDIHVCRT